MGILLAAGLGRRIGTPKALLRVSGETFYRRATSTFRDANIALLAVVNDQVDEALEPPDEGEIRLLNPDPDQAAGMLSSIKIGVAAAIERGATGAILLPVDHPLVTANDIRAIVRELLGGAIIVVPTHEMKRGHPIGISRRVMDEIALDPSVETLRDVVRKDPLRVREVAASKGVRVGINTQDDLERASTAGFR